MTVSTVEKVSESTEDNYSDPEDFVDKFDEQDLLGDVLSQEPTPSLYEECCIMVFNMPKVNDEKLLRLRSVLAVVFSIEDRLQYTDHFPTDDDKITKGYCFVEYQTKEAATDACLVLDGYRLDKKHTFSAYPLSSMREVKKPDPDWKEPEKRPYIDVGNIWWWLQNPKCTDQFAVQFEQDGNPQVNVFWYDRNNDPAPISQAQRSGWTESLFKWSPYGSYMVTMHKQGVAFWAGEKFERIQRISHEGVSFLDFSSTEKYLITFAKEERRHIDNENSIRIFDAFTGELKKSFSPYGRSSHRSFEWPFIKWSFDDRHFAFIRPRSNAINLFEAEQFSLCGNSPIALEGLVKMEFNPAKNLLAYYCEERPSANSPAIIGVMKIPSKQEQRVQRTFSVSDARIFWQKSGDHLASYTERYGSKKINKEGETKLTGVTYHLEIFDCTDFSVQTLQLPEAFVNFAWEPKGNKFCVLVSSVSKVTPLVYKVDRGKNAPQLMSKIEPGIQLNKVEWAPQGGWLVVFAENSPTGNVLFIDTNGMEAVKIRMVEHPVLNQGSWDPTGRYFATCTFARSRYESSYRIYSFQGRELVRKNIDTLNRFKWRPRPPVQLSEQKIKEIKKSMKQISAKFEEEDRRELQKISKELLELRRKMKIEFAEFKSANIENFDKDKDERLKLRGGIEKSEDEDFVEETITIPLTTQIEKIPPEDSQ